MVLHLGQIVRTKRWASTASTEEATRNGSIPMSINRVKALGGVVGVEGAEDQVAGQAARMAISAVSRSRISPTMMTLGSWRRMWRNPMAKVSPMSPRTAIWLIPFNAYSTGSSMVMIRWLPNRSC